MRNKSEIFHRYNYFFRIGSCPNNVAIINEWKQKKLQYKVKMLRNELKDKPSSICPTLF